MSFLASPEESLPPCFTSMETGKDETKKEDTLVKRVKKNPRMMVSSTCLAVWVKSSGLTTEGICYLTSIPDTEANSAVFIEMDVDGHQDTKSPLSKSQAKRKTGRIHKKRRNKPSVQVTFPSMERAKRKVAEKKRRMR